MNASCAFDADGLQDHTVVPDQIRLNGFRARVTCLTAPGPVHVKCPDSNGKVRWVGVTCNTTYEAAGGGPFTHRRLLFKSTIPWPAGTLAPYPSDTASGGRPGEYVRQGARSLSNGKLAACLSRLFVQGTVRGVLQGPTSTLGITVLRDEKYAFNGNDDGLRKSKKYWNAFSNEPVMQYNLLPTGSFDFSLSNSPSSQHIYLVDIYSYGLQGLDSSLPDPKTVSAGAPSGTPAGAFMDHKPAKRSRSDDSVMSEASNGSFSTGTLTDALLDPMRESDDGSVSIVTEMKLYFRKAK